MHLFNCSIILCIISEVFASTGQYGRRHGNVILGGLFPVHEYESPQRPCGAISQFRGIQRLEAMIFAIEQINADRHLLPGIELGALILDTCSDDNYALEQSLRFVRSRLASATCTCVNESLVESFHNDYVFGVVGGTLSSVSVTVANLLRLFQLPQISYASTTPKLSEPSFDYFARTVPSDSNQARAIVDILQRLNFTYVNTIYSHGDYGEGGFREFKRLLKLSTIGDELTNSTRKRQQRICIADEQRLKRDVSIYEIKNILEPMLERSKTDVQVNVYVLFVTKEDARKLLQAIKLFNGTHRPILIASDAWGKESSVVINGETDEIAVGALTLELVSIQPYAFEKYFNSLRPNLVKENLHENDDTDEPISSIRNPWFNEFWEYRFGCKLSSDSSCTNYQLNETNWDSKLQFIVDAVYVFAQALHAYFNCTSTICLSPSFNNINGTQLFQIILEKTFSMPDFRHIQFNSERFVPGHYRIYNYRRSHLASTDINALPYEYVSVGEWKIGRHDIGQLNLAIDSIVWPGSNSSSIVPISRCSEPCRIGELKQFQGDSCCWVCTSCPETSIVNDTDEHERCERCEIGYWPTANRTACYKLKETYIEILSVQALVPISFSLLGNLLTLYVVILFYQKRETPIVKASGKELCFIMLGGIHLCYLMTFPILLRPRLLTCLIQRLGIGLGFSMMYSALLTKTNRIARIFESTKKQGRLRPQYISPHSQVAICSCLIAVQLFISLLWFAYERPGVTLVGYDRLVILKCSVDKHTFLYSLSYNVILVLICTMYAIRTRKVPENFNETKFIGFTCYTTCIIWLAFLPIYFTANEANSHQVHVMALCITISLCASVALVCLFSPKVYIILFHPEKNMRLTKQLKAQANSIKFASQLANKQDLPTQRSFLNDLSTSDGQTKSFVSNDVNDDHCQTLVNHTQKQSKMPTIITTNQSIDDNCTTNEKYQLKIQRFHYDDNDSLNSNPGQDEDIMI